MLVSGYVGAWVVLPQWPRHGWIDWTTVDMLETTVFAPIHVYIVEEWPGSGSLSALRDIVNGRVLDQFIEA